MSDRGERMNADHKHDWTSRKVVGYTGDWFKPRIVERECRKCGETEREDQ